MHALDTLDARFPNADNDNFERGPEKKGLTGQEVTNLVAPGPWPLPI